MSDTKYDWTQVGNAVSVTDGLGGYKEYLRRYEEARRRAMMCGSPAASTTGTSSIITRDLSMFETSELVYNKTNKTLYINNGSNLLSINGNASYHPGPSDELVGAGKLSDLETMITERLKDE